MDDEVLKRSMFVLVDHQKPTSPLILPENVIRIFDHHEWSKDVIYPHLVDNVDITIKHVDSCSLIIADHVLLSTKPQQFTQILRLLRGAIIMDYNNFSDIQENTSVWKVFNDLESKLRAQVFERVKAAKLDISGLDSMKLLKKDLKYAHTKTGNVKVALPWFPATIKVSASLMRMLQASGRVQ